MACRERLPYMSPDSLYLTVKSRGPARNDTRFRVWFALFMNESEPGDPPPRPGRRTARLAISMSLFCFSKCLPNVFDAYVSTVVEQFAVFIHERHPWALVSVW